MSNGVKRPCENDIRNDAGRAKAPKTYDVTVDDGSQHLDVSVTSDCVEFFRDEIRRLTECYPDMRKRKINGIALKNTMYMFGMSKSKNWEHSPCHDKNCIFSLIEEGWTYLEETTVCKDV